MKSKKRNPLCKAPFYSAVLMSDGVVTPCCSYDASRSNPNIKKPIEHVFYGSKFDTLRQQMLEHEWPEGCHKCKNRESKGIKSHRDTMNSKLFFDNKLIDTPQIRYLEVNYSNLCNLKCRMCDSGLSSKWIEDEKKLREKIDFRSSTPLKLHENYIDPNIYNDIEEVHFKGGEPTLDPQFKSFFENLSEERSKNLSVKVTTNGTYVDKKTWTRIFQCKKVHIEISLESGKDELYRYIRGGQYGLDHLTDNVKKLIEMSQPFSTEHKFYFNITCSMYNIFDYNNIIEWYNKIKTFDKNNKIKPLEFGIFLVNPRYLSIDILPDSYKSKLCKELYNNTSVVHKLFRGQQTPYLQEFVDFTRELDTIRGENLLEIEPRFQEILDFI